MKLRLLIKGIYKKEIDYIEVCLFFSIKSNYAKANYQQLGKGHIVANVYLPLFDKAYIFANYVAKKLAETFGIAKYYSYFCLQINEKKDLNDG